MTDLTPDDLARLRVPLSALPGLDPVGLRVYWSSFSSVIVGPQDHDGLYPVHHEHGVGCLSEGFLHLSDAATRDRCARYLAQRVEVDVGSTAPNWGPDAFHRGLWWLVGPDDGWHREVADLEAYDDRRLPDGSWWVDAAALAAVLRGAP